MAVTISRGRETILSPERRVPVVYYLCRNGNLEHPHFMEVPLGSNSNEGLYLRDVINRLNILRGNGIRNMYSWSSKRSYKNGYVWQDLSEDDFIHPVHGQEYVLKGSEVHQRSVSFRWCETKTLVNKTEEKRVLRRNQSSSSIDLNVCKVYKAKLSSGLDEKASDAWTQTEEKNRERKLVQEEKEALINQSTELSREEISPPPPSTLSLDSADSGMNSSKCSDESRNNPSGKLKTSTVFIQLISCGALTKNQQFSLIPQLKATLPRAVSSISREMECLIERFPRFCGRRLEEEYFNRNLLIEKTKKN